MRPNRSLLTDLPAMWDAPAPSHVSRGGTSTYQRAELTHGKTPTHGAVCYRAGMHLRIVLACLAAVYACSSSPKAASETLETPTAKPVATAVANVPTNQLVHEPQDVRRLLEHATFADLVHVATRLDDEAQPHSTAGCLLRGQGNLRLEADLSLAARPLPRPPERVIESIV
ncbi:MAG: hypothetical protein RL701_5295, partial [Pseudomonadota bacterium]